MPKYFFPPETRNDNTITLTGDPAHHLLHVLRLKQGDGVILCDGQNTDYRVCLTRAHDKQPSATFQIMKTMPCTNEPSVAITLYQALPKGDKMETIIQKNVELGVCKIVPVETNRSVARIKNHEKKTERYQRIAESAAGQSMRGIVPTVEAPLTFAEAVAAKPENMLWLVCDENENTRYIKEVLCGGEITQVGIWVGPEGGFSQDELAQLHECGACSVTLGRRILRTETAGMSAIVQVLCHLGGL